MCKPPLPSSTSSSSSPHTHTHTHTGQIYLNLCGRTRPINTLKPPGIKVCDASLQRGHGQVKCNDGKVCVCVCVCPMRLPQGRQTTARQPRARRGVRRAPTAAPSAGDQSTPSRRVSERASERMTPRICDVTWDGLGAPPSFPPAGLRCYSMWLQRESLLIKRVQA